MFIIIMFCIATDPPPVGFREKEKKGTSVVLTWYPPAACYKAENTLLFVKGSKAKKEHSVSGEVTEFEVKGLQPNTDYELQAFYMYEGDVRSTEPTVFLFNSGDCHADDYYCGLPPFLAKFYYGIYLCVAVTS